MRLPKFIAKLLGKKRVVTRIAPSPTGNLHVGTARSALFNYLFARHHGGEFILRIEDTDRARSTATFEEDITRGLEWIGLSWDSFYRQSERTALYREYLERIISSGRAYVSREPSPREGEGENEVVRLKNSGAIVRFNDLIRGDIEFDTKELGDFVIARSLDEPLYHLAVVVDDALMGVTHVIRGEDHISNTPRQILIQEALGFSRPAYAHIPLILAPDRSKLSKRHGAVSISTYRETGFLPEALVNYLALLGWNPGTDRELFSLDELVREFDLTRVQKGGAIFDIEKLSWFNHEHLKKLSADEFLALIEPRIPARVRGLSDYSVERLVRLVPAIRERVRTLAEFTDFAEKGEYDYCFAFEPPKPEIVHWKKDPNPKSTLRRLAKSLEILRGISDSEFIPTRIQEAVSAYAEGEGKGEVFWPLRVALTGRERSVDPATAAFVLGKEESLRRISAVSATLVE